MNRVSRGLVAVSTPKEILEVMTVFELFMVSIFYSSYGKVLFFKYRHQIEKVLE
jgi:hypothetical protein